MTLCSLKKSQTNKDVQNKMVLWSELVGWFRGVWSTFQSGKPARPCWETSLNQLSQNSVMLMLRTWVKRLAPAVFSAP